MGKVASKSHGAKHASPISHSADKHSAKLQRLEALIKRREELVSNAESKYLTFQRKNVQKLKPGTLGKTHRTDHPAFYNIGFFGMPAVGKSSLLNSIYLAVIGVFPATQKVQVVPLGYEGKYPTRTQRLHVTRHMCMIAHSGTELEDVLENKEAVLSTVREQLCGSSRQRPSVLPDEIIKDHAQHSAKKTHCAVVVIRPSILETTKKQYVLLINEIYNYTGRYPVGLITNFDALGQDKIMATRVFMQTHGISDIFEVESTHVNPLPMKDEIALLDMIERCMCLSDKMFEEQEDAQ